jgi:S1-C subfamily serine protease
MEGSVARRVVAVVERRHPRASPRLVSAAGLDEPDRSTAVGRGVEGSTIGARLFVAHRGWYVAGTPSFQAPNMKAFTPRRLVLACALLSALAQAADVDLKQPVPQTPRKTAISFSGLGEQVDFTTWKSAVVYGDLVGQVEFGMFCTGARNLPYTKKLDDWFSTALARTYREEAVRIGIGVPEAAKSVFDEKAGKAAGFQLGATLLAWDYRTCNDGDEVKGNAFSRIKWELFSSRRQKVVYSTVVEASHGSTARVADKKFDAEFMQSIIQNLFADPKLAEVIRSGGAIDQEPAKALATLQLKSGPTVGGGVATAAPALLAAVVTIESGVGTGSGFYISREGYVLTNEHVVAGAAFVRVRLADGRSVVGEVLRTDKARDVALLRTDAVAADALALRAGGARVGEEVYALGSPFGKVLSGTLTRGVVSAKRVIDGVAYLQSDVAINPGNSGGPMVDADGRVLGIAQLGSTGQGLSLFIPIEEAIERLAIVLGGNAAVAQGK